MAEKKCRAYNGNMTYGFISYAHADDGRVLPVVSELLRQRYRIWYDEGIEAGANWPQKVAVRLKESGLVLLFLSERFLRSQNCMRELNYAVAERRKMFCVLLDRVSLPEDVAMQLATVEKLDASGMDAQAIVAKLQRQNVLDETFLGDGKEGYGDAENGKRRRKVNVWQLASVFFALLFLGSLAFGYGYVNGWFRVGVHSAAEVVAGEDGGEEQLVVTTWGDAVSRDLMLRTTKDTVIYLCGNTILNLASQIRYEDGWYAGNQPVENGGLADFSVLEGKKLTHLAVVDQKLTDISALSEFTELVYLDISGNEVEDLAPLRGLKGLEILKIRHIAARDLAVLKELPSLKYVYVSEDMCPYISDILDGGFEVIVKK